jgi:hypothetical protein
MTPLADMVEKMLADGVSEEVIVLAVRAAEQAVSGIVRRQSADVVDEQAERRRQKDRDRAQERRERLRTSADNPQISADAKSALSFLEVSKKREEVEEKKERAKPNSVRRRSGHTLPPEWTPSADHFAQGADLKIERADVLAMAEDMRLWARANEHRAVARKSDWNLTFSAWMRREAPKRRANGQRSRNSGRADESAILAAMARGFGFENGGGEAARPADEEIPRGRVELDLEPAGGGRARKDAA